MTEKRFLKGLTEIWQRLTGAEDDDAPVPHAWSDDGYDDQPLRMGLDELLSEQAGRYATKLHVVSLAGFRRQVGDRWLKLADKVMMIGESVLHRHVGHDGSFGRRDDMFVIVFSRLTRSEGAARAKAAAEELGQRLLGSARFTGESLVFCAEVDTNAALSADGTIDVAVLDNAVAEAQQAEDEALRAQGGRPSAGEPLRRHLQPSDWQAPGQEHRALHETARRETAARQFHAAQPATVLSDEAAAPADGAEHRPEARWQVQFVATWLAAGESLSGQFCRVLRQDSADAKPLVGSAAYTGGSLALALDKMVAATAARTLRDLATKHPKVVLIVPVSFRSLITRQRMMLTGVYADVPDAVRLLRLDFELFDVPEAASPRQVLDAAAALRPLGRDILLRVRPDHPTAALAADCGFDGIGFDIAEMTADELHPERLAAALSAVHGAAAEAGLAAHVWSLPNRAAIRAAAALGYARLNGPGLAAATDRPCAPVAAPRDRLIG